MRTPDESSRKCSAESRTVTPEGINVMCTVPQAQRVTRAVPLLTSSVCGPQRLLSAMADDSTTLVPSVEDERAAGAPRPGPTGIEATACSPALGRCRVGPLAP